MVQLKDGTNIEFDDFMIFQFLMVQLKENNKIVGAKPSPFQFLMVQLKERRTSTMPIISSISIPYGSIKSHFLFELYHFFHGVSIPYGSIKSVRSIC